MANDKMTAQITGKDGFIAGYNGQIAVDHAHQVIVAQRLATNPADYAALLPLVDQAKANLGRKPKEVSGDSGFATEANIAGMIERRIAACGWAPTCICASASISRWSASWSARSGSAA